MDNKEFLTMIKLLLEAYLAEKQNIINQRKNNEKDINSCLEEVRKSLQLMVSGRTCPTCKGTGKV